MLSVILRPGMVSSKNVFDTGLSQMVIASVFFSLMGLCVRLLPRIPFMEIVVVRAAISLVISAALLLRARKALLGKNKALLTLRGVFGFAALSAYFYSIQHLSLAEAVTIQYTNPLFTAFFAPLLLRERGNNREWIAGIVAFAGVLLIAGPSEMTKSFPAAVGLLGAMCSGVAYNLVRKLGMEKEDPLTIVLYFPLVAVIGGLPVAAISWVTPSLIEMALLLAVGLTTQIAQVAMTKGLTLERASKATIVNYLVIVLSTLYSIALGESLALQSIAGMILIAAGIFFVSRQTLLKFA